MYLILGHHPGSGPWLPLGWPDEEAMEEKGLDYFYPTSALVTWSLILSSSGLLA
jgi:hypothetical protein